MTKFKKKMLALLASMLGLVGATAATSGLAWFTAASTVQVSGMTMQAAAEQGIVISNEGKTEWKTSATVSHTGADKAFVPTSTATTTAWYHAYADDANNGQSGVEYNSITPVEYEGELGIDGDGVYGFNENGTWKPVYLLNKLYIKSSSAAAISAQDIYVQNFTFSTPSQALSNALRVAVVKAGENTPIIVASSATSTTSYSVHGDTATTAILPANTTNVTTLEVDSNVSIPAFSTDTPLEYYVYCYYEGEDVACKSANIVANLENVNISFKFGNKNHD